MGNYFTSPKPYKFSKKNLQYSTPFHGNVTDFRRKEI